MQHAPTKDDLALVARKLGDLHERCFLAGGTSIPFYLDQEPVDPPRMTYDIDVVIEVASKVEFLSQIESKLKTSGFVHDVSEGAPICRWRLANIIVDIMPTDEDILGFSNPWYRAGKDHLTAVQITEDCSWKIMGAPYALASKLTAFWARGASDPKASHDLEDIVSILYGRRAIVAEVLGSPEDCRSYIMDCCDRILSNERLEDAIESHILPDNFATDRLKVVKEKMRAIRTGR